MSLTKSDIELGNQLHQADDGSVKRCKTDGDLWPCQMAVLISILENLNSTVNVDSIRKALLRRQQRNAWNVPPWDSVEA